MKKRIGIITLCRNNNFGNKLQNYALKKVLENKENDVYTIWIENPYKSNKLKCICKKLTHEIDDYIISKDRNRYFIEFNKKYLNIYKKKIIFNNDIDRIKRKFDYFFVGSDQVWNYNFFDNEKIYFLMSVERKKCISYAASIGVETIPDKRKEQYINGLNHFEALSVRENEAKKTITNITGRQDVEVLIDPTMMLSGEEWSKIERRPKAITNKNFVLNYFLGKIPKERKERIEEFARKNNCKIINILDKNDLLYNCGPREFLWLERNAKLICTDSFHSCVFGILFKTPFVVFDRKMQNNGNNMKSRIDTLLDKFEMKKNYDCGEAIELSKLEEDYSKIDKILSYERNKSNNFINNALKISNIDKE